MKLLSILCEIIYLSALELVKSCLDSSKVGRGGRRQQQFRLQWQFRLKLLLDYFDARPQCVCYLDCTILIIINLDIEARIIRCYLSERVDDAQGFLDISVAIEPPL